METTQDGPPGISELKDEISELRMELRRFMTTSGRQHIDSILNELKADYADLFREQQMKTAGSDLFAHMVNDCAMREKCYGVFLDFLRNTSRHIEDGNVSEEIVNSYRDELKNLRSKGPSDKCDTCFSEVSRLFEKQVDLMESLGIYSKVKDEDKTRDIDDAKAVKEVLEPLANIQRFQILKSLTTQTRTFSEISHITGLRGGNLLFHIKKLADSEMIFQRHERGDYMITKKGYKTMNSIFELSRQLENI
ncbi:winged helix-turn-helix domain-containing protein [Methanomicrobium antiquum]|jgi:DNA-binding transcriptional ArsR family regulator|uniref:Winged helix-turn-helix domain-containing protein n=1 Tax=Methanomicrobium antiquum TaxID=487686 RepID=A0AAF0FPE6_9EURY|nr:winged helix-turn-helix domain-containing protein [Methanomicrobium antiquum]WFN37192.1 winged helix-turn-helix domain-containing protein [Methanomicrobium antiquum]